MRKKIAIISSYNEACGNASYTEVLRRGFEEYCDVDVFPLQLDLLYSNQRQLVHLGNKHIKDMAAKLKNYDYVNIQFEAALFGSNRERIFKRVKTLINASRNVIVTMHRVDIPQSYFDISALKALLSNNIIKNIKYFRRSFYYASLYEKVVKCVAKKSKSDNAAIIVHTPRDRKNIQLLFRFDRVYDFPLTFLNKEQRQRERTVEERSIFNKAYGLKDTDVSIGLFGFVTEYKGHETAISALRFLPDNYKILIFGSQHPTSIQNGVDVDGYLKKLIDLIESSPNFSQRVFFVGNLNDDEFINALYCCDFAVLPYMEVNQSGSGIASLVLESKIKAIFSNNKAFKELQKYYPNSFEQFDIGNYAELAYKIINYHVDYSAALDKLIDQYNIENNVKLHLDIFEGKR